MSRAITIVLVIMAAVISQPAAARPVVSAASSIAAVVGEEAITTSDVNQRLKFIFATTNFSDTSESVARLTPQVLRSLIDEKLQLQEGRRNSIDLSEREVEQAIAAIENQRGIPAGGIQRMLKEKKISEDTFLQQIKAQLVWGKLLSRKVRSRIVVTDEEVDEMVRRLSRPVIKQELKIGLLQLPVDKPSREKEVREAAERMVLEVRSGANFEELARQFAGGSVLENGQLSSFWVRPEQLEPIIAQALEKAQKGDLSNPLRNSLGYLVIKVYDTRDLPDTKPTGTEITFREIILGLRANSTEKDMEMLREVAEAIEKNPGNCKDETIADVENTELASIAVERDVSMLSDLPPALKVLAEGMQVGDVSTPFASDEGVKIYQLCGKREGVEAPIDRERARSVAYQQRMELEAQKYMRNLRRDTFIEVR